MDNEVTWWLIGSGALFLVFGVIGGWWRMRTEARRRQDVFAQRYGGNVHAILALVGPDERDVLRRLRRTNGAEGAAIRLRKVDPELPFDTLVEAVKHLD